MTESSHSDESIQFKLTLIEEKITSNQSKLNYAVAVLGVAVAAVLIPCALVVNYSRDTVYENKANIIAHEKILDEQRYLISELRDTSNFIKISFEQIKVSLDKNNDRDRDMDIIASNQERLEKDLTSLKGQFNDIKKFAIPTSIQNE